MSTGYNKTAWQDGDIITADKMNNIENGIKDLHELADTKAPVIYGSASGAIASFKDGADDLPMKSLVCNIEPVQDLHGYDNPWPAGGGANLLDLSKASFSSGAYGLSITRSGDIVTVSGTVSNTTLTNLSFAIITNYSTDELSGKGYVCQVFMVGTPTHSISGVWGFRTESERAFAISITNAPQGSVVNVSFKMSVSASSQASWTPYSNICPISGRTGVSVVKAGKNLLWKSRQSSTMNGITWTLNDDGSITASGTSTGRSYIRIIVSTRDAYTLPKGTYTYSLTPTGSDYTNIYSLIGSYKGNKYYKNVCAVGSSTNFAKTFTWNDSDLAAVLDISVEIERANKTVNCTVYPQIELGTTATDYEPYKGNTYSVNWETEAGTVYGGSLDVVSGKLTADKRYVLLSNPNKWINSPGSTVNFAYTDFFNDRLIVSDSFSNLICSYMPVVSGAAETARWRGATSLQFGLKNNTLTLEQIRSDATDGKISICYSLATPIEIQITPHEVHTLLGENNIWSDGGDVTAEYPADTKMYIEKLTAPTEDDMIADHAISANSFFMVGNTLYRATTAIASGATITVGTNAVKLSLSDALNALA